MMQRMPWLIFGTLLLTGGCNMQNQFLYFPSSEIPSARMLASENMVVWQANAGDYRGITAARDPAGANGTIVLFHGNGGTAADRGFYFEPFMALGFRVILAEYPCYGGRPGTLGEKHFVADGVETLKQAHEQYEGPLYLAGESLGCGVAASIARQTPTPVSGMILFTPWDTLAAVAKSLFPFLPVKMLLTDKYDTVGNLSTFKGKIAVVGAEQDEILPIQHAHALYASLPRGKKRMWVIQGAGHNDWPFYAPPSLFKEVMDFVKIDPQ
jgi:pimeloyl-ACP methyl ester carboxylesterase